MLKQITHHKVFSYEWNHVQTLIQKKKCFLQHMEKQYCSIYGQIQDQTKESKLCSSFSEFDQKRKFTSEKSIAWKRDINFLSSMQSIKFNRDILEDLKNQGKNIKLCKVPTYMRIKCYKAADKQDYLIGL